MDISGKKNTALNATAKMHDVQEKEVAECRTIMEL
jgi:hypothetical protein